MRFREKIWQKVVQIKQWLDKQRAKTDECLWLLVIVILLDLNDIVTVIRIVAFLIRHGLEVLYKILPILIKIFEFIESLASTFSYYKKEFFLWIFLLQSCMAFPTKSIYQNYCT